jgi:hypothetical protein
MSTAQVIAMPTNPVEAALTKARELARQGLSSFPCRDDKKPACPHGFKDATRDEQKLIELWRKYPGTLVGVPTGKENGFDVLDYDHQHEKARQWYDEHYDDLPETRGHNTRSGGYHFIFQHRPGLRCSTGKICKGVDVRADGGYIIWWPATGLGSEDKPVAPFPEWLAQAASGSKASSRVRPAVDKATSPIAAAMIGEGADAIHIPMDPPPAGLKDGDGRDDWLFRWGCKLVNDGWTYDQILAELRHRNSTFADKLDDSVVVQKADQAWKYNTGKTEVPPDVAQQVLPFERTEKGKLRAKSYANTHNGLLQLNLKFQHDVFHDKKLVDGKELSDGLCRDFREQILRHQQADPGIDNVRQAAERLCEANAFDPVVDYLAEVQPKWDKKPRLDTWLIDYMGADDTPLNRAIGSRVLIASVRRARKPGTKFDEITVLESPEGFGKSEALSDLYGAENFSDQKILSVGERELQEKFNGVWCAEIADLTGMKRAEIEDVKAMASRITDRGRPAYGRFVVRQLRRTIIWATTNDDKYLKSQTGNRRFLPVKCGKQINKADLRRDRNQLWAEAAHREAQGEATVLPKELWAAAQAEQNARLIEDPWDAHLEGVVGTVIGDEERVFTKTIFKTWLEIPAERQTEATGARLRACMKRLGWEHKPTAIRIWNEVGKGYVRPARPEARNPMFTVMEGGRPRV